MGGRICSLSLLLSLHRDVWLLVSQIRRSSFSCNCSYKFSFCSFSTGGNDICWCKFLLVAESVWFPTKPSEHSVNYSVWVTNWVCKWIPFNTSILSWSLDVAWQSYCLAVVYIEALLKWRKKCWGPKLWLVLIWIISFWCESYSPLSSDTLTLQRSVHDPCETRHVFVGRLKLLPFKLAALSDLSLWFNCCVVTTTASLCTVDDHKGHNDWELIFCCNHARTSLQVSGWFLH